MIEMLGEILPLAIFILIPILRGVNNSQKQKKQYQEKKRRVSYNQKGKDNSPKLWENIRKEVTKELNKKHKKEDGEDSLTEVQESKDFYQEVFEEDDRVESISSTVLEQSSNVEATTFQDTVVPTNIGETDTYKSRQDLEFSDNPLVQGIIFSEILGPPKAIHNRYTKNS